MERLRIPLLPPNLNLRLQLLPLLLLVAIRAKVISKPCLKNTFRNRQLRDMMLTFRRLILKRSQN